MSIIESLSVSLFCMALVFFVLSFLFLLIKILSKVLNALNNKLSSVSVDKTNSNDIYANQAINSNEISTGELKLIGVDEKTAAMIMAIVSHETKIPLSELIFKSIKAID